MKKYLRVLVLFILPLSLLAQSKEATIWYFGNKAGVDFNTDPPSYLLDGQMDVEEGCAALAGTNGKLLAYTDGKKVWNAKHEVMSNGILCCEGTPYQAAVFIPYPDHKGECFLFTSMVTDSNAAVRYSLIDFNEGDGYGTIKPSQKDVVLHSPATEQMTVVANKDESIFWLVCSAYNGHNIFLNVYRIDKDGVNTLPSVYALDYETSVSVELKFSPNGKVLAWINGDPRYLCGLADFNSETGMISNICPIGTGNTFFNINWLEFSSNSQFLYAHDGQNIFQYDMTVPESSAIISSKQLVGNGSAWNKGQMQLAPNGKIYVANYSENKKYLGVINYPNRKGSACGFEERGLYLGGRVSEFGLPTFCQSFLSENKIRASSGCNLFQEFSVVDADEGSDFFWDFGDGVSSHLKYATHTYQKAGTYTVRLELTHPDNTTETLTKEITIYPTPTTSAIQYEP